MPTQNIRLANPEQPELDKDDDLDEAGEIIRALRLLADRASSPIIKVCLEDACHDIEHLTGNAAASDGASINDAGSAQRTPIAA